METCERCGLPFATSASDLSKYDQKCFTRFPTAANVDGCRWAREKRKKLLAESMMVSALADAREEGRAAGRREGIEIAAELIDKPAIMDGRAAARFVRGLLIPDDAPATTKETK